MTPRDAEAAAAFLHESRAARRPIGTLPDGLAPRDEEDGVAIQHALAVRVGAANPAGFKIGATSVRMQQYLGVDAPVGGFMVPAGLHASGTALAYADFHKPAVECELVARLGTDLPPGPCSLEQAAAAVAELVCGIEVVEGRYVDVQAVGVPTMVADQMFHAAAVLGEQGGVDWRGLDLVALPGGITIDGAPQGGGVGGDLLGHPLNSLCWLAGSSLARRFGGLKAGQVVMLGSVIPPLWLVGPCTVRVAFPPLPAVTVTFT
jgi:2-keto-4-pentenoate hydratase